jgi:hypothetical protein
MKNSKPSSLQDLKINIQAQNDSNYQELAVFFDKPKVLDMLSNMRKTYGISSLQDVRNYDDVFDSYCPRGYENYIEPTSVDFSKYTKLERIKNAFPNFYSRISARDMEIVFLEGECYLMCYEFNRQSNFSTAIKQALFCGAIAKGAFKSTQASVVDTENMFEELSLPSIAIYISPSSTYKELEEEFRNAKQMMATDERFSYCPPRTDFAPNIRKYREWYWERLKGKTYQLIADEWLTKHENENTTYLDVLKAVKTYKKLLAI